MAGTPPRQVIFTVTVVASDSNSTEAVPAGPRTTSSVPNPWAGLHLLAAGDLSARATAEGPAEVREVTAALNHLAGRIRVLLAQEREAVADLSHRLRTPLTALRLEAETLPAGEHAERVGEAVEAMERMVTEVIKEARRSRQEAAGQCDAVRVVADRVDYWSMLARDQDRSVERDITDGPLPVRLTEEALGTCVDALLENVFAHTPDTSGFSVSLHRRGGGAVLVIDDQGAGFAHHDPARRGVSASSTGLGLDIARRAAERSGGSLTLGASPRDGGRVVVEFGPPTR